jgi:hypothetical protein
MNRKMHWSSKMQIKTVGWITPAIFALTIAACSARIIDTSNFETGVDDASLANAGNSGGADSGGTGGRAGVGGENRGGAGNAGASTTHLAGSGGVGGALADAGGTIDTAGAAGSVNIPPVDDYAAPGPFSDAIMISNTGPNGAYTLFRPDATLGKDGFKHPIVAWGNGVDTTPDNYASTLILVATHGFVIIAPNDTRVEEPAISAGLDWLVEQNSSGDMAGTLDTTREATIGYSWGGGASIDAAYRPNVKCTISLHGMPPRNTDAFETMHAPLLLTTSTGDTYVSKGQFVTPNFESSIVQTFYSTLNDNTINHLYIVDPNAFSCIVSILLGACGSAEAERAPVIAWLRLWVYGDQDARRFFYGDDCLMCQDPWTDPQRKNWQ